jgi:hypothetical protein
LTRAEIAAYSKLRGRPIVLCFCGHEVYAPSTAHDVRRLTVHRDQLAHRACVRELAS